MNNPPSLAHKAAHFTLQLSLPIFYVAKYAFLRTILYISITGVKSIGYEIFIHLSTPLLMSRFAASEFGSISTDLSSNSSHSHKVFFTDCTTFFASYRG